MDHESIEYLEQYIEVTDDIQEAIEDYAEKHGIEPKICAYYENHEDFLDDWESVGYTRGQAEQLLQDSPNEFMNLPDGLGRIRFTL